MDKLCPECGQLVKGRRDKKYCDDTCRNAHNNKVKFQRYDNLRQINRILSKNRNILESLLPVDTKKVKRERLEDLGFNFRHVTQVEGINSGSPYYFCYEFGYVITEDGHYVLIKRKESEL